MAESIRETIGKINLVVKIIKCITELQLIEVFILQRVLHLAPYMPGLLVLKVLSSSLVDTVL